MPTQRAAALGELAQRLNARPVRSAAVAQLTKKTDTKRKRLKTDKSTTRDPSRTGEVQQDSIASRVKRVTSRDEPKLTRSKPVKVLKNQKKTTRKKPAKRKSTAKKSSTPTQTIALDEIRKHFIRDGNRSSVFVTTPFGRVKMWRVREKVPYVAEHGDDHTGSNLGTDYASLLKDLTSGKSGNKELAGALLDGAPFDDLEDKPKRAAALLTGLIEIENMRKKGAKLLFRGYLEAVKSGNLSLTRNHLLEYFQFAQNGGGADLGRRQIAKIVDNYAQQQSKNKQSVSKELTFTGPKSKQTLVMKFDDIDEEVLTDEEESNTLSLSQGRHFYEKKDQLKSVAKKLNSKRKLDDSYFEK